VGADSVAFLVLAGLGVEASSYSFPYVAGWSGGDPKIVAEVGGTVVQAARQLLDQIDSTGSRVVADRPVA
jgi:hypothetical protein